MHVSGQRLLALFLPCVLFAAACGGAEETIIGDSQVDSATTVTEASSDEPSSEEPTSEDIDDTGDAAVEESAPTTTALAESVETTEASTGETVVDEPATTLPDDTESATTVASGSDRSDEDRMVTIAHLVDAGLTGWGSNGAEPVEASTSSGDTCGAPDPNITEGYAGEWEGPDGTTLAQLIQKGPNAAAWIPAFVNLADCSTSDVPPMRIGDGAVAGADEVAILEPNGSDEDGGYAASIVARKGDIIVAFVVETNDSASPALATDFLITLAESALAD